MYICTIYEPIKTILLMKKLLLSLAAITALSFSANADIIQNGGFESWTEGTPDHWKTATSAGNATLEQSTDAHGGSYSVLVKGIASNNKRLGYEETTLAAGTYNVTFYAKAAAADNDTASVRPGYVPVVNGSVGNYVYGDYTNGIKCSEWTQVTYSFTLDAAQTVCLVVMNSKNHGDVLIDDYSIVTSDGGTTDPVDPQPGDNTSIANTPETAYTVAKAHDLITAGEGLNDKVYVKGYITQIDEVSAQHGNATYYINDTQVTDGQLEVFRGKYLGGEAFTAEDQIKVGDVVIVYGNLKDYNGTHEFNTGSQIYSLNGQTAGGETPVDPNPEELVPDSPINGDYFVNGNFESWTDGAPDNWHSASTAGNATLLQETDAHSGTYSVLIEGASSNKRLAYKELVLKAGTYTFSLYAKGEDGNEDAEVRLGFAPWKADGSLGSYSYGDYVKVPSAEGWKVAYYIFTLAEKTKLNMVVMNPKNLGNVLVDDAKLEEGDKSESIRTISADLNNAVIYDILGKRVNSLDKKGVYVVNGKKVVVK